MTGSRYNSSIRLIFDLRCVALNEQFQREHQKLILCVDLTDIKLICPLKFNQC